MEQIYKWNIQNYNWHYIDKGSVKWLWSEKKQKYYAKIEWQQYMTILFKNDYILVFEKWKSRDIVPVRNYYYVMRDGVAYEVTPPKWIPF